MLSRKELNDPDARTAALVRELVHTGTLSGGIRIPNTVGPINLEANLRRMTAEASIELIAPELTRPLSRITWLLRQLRNAPAELRIDAAFERKRSTSSDLLARVAENPKRLLTERDHAPRSFTLTLSGVVGAKRKAGKASFISDISGLLDHFYRDVVQDLKPWTPPAPQLRSAETAATDSEEHHEA